jgi:hypothetical protein
MVWGNLFIFEQILFSTSLSELVYAGHEVIGLVFQIVLYTIKTFQEIPLLKADNYQGGVGHMVAAALQTKGIIDQAKILENFEDLKMIAAMFYLFAIGMAVGAVAVFGNYQQGLYLLVGPVFFHYAVTETTEADGVATRLGGYIAPNSINSNNEFLRFIRAIDENDPLTIDNNGEVNGATRNVSLLFATVDSITTEVIQAVIDTFLNTKNRDHLRFVARENALAYVMMGITETTALNRMISESFMGECSEVFTRAVRYGTGYIANPRVRERNQAELAQVKQELDNLMTEKTVALDREVKHFLKVFKNAKGFEDVPDLPIEDPWMVSCGSVWKWIGAGSQLIATQKLDPENFEGLTRDDSDTPWDEVYADVEELISQGGGNEDAVKILSAYIFKNTLHYSTHSTLQSQVFSHGTFEAKEAELFLGKIGESERHGGFMMIKYLAGVIPYIQGLLLYLLSIAYPFFAILLVIPGKATSFLIWCSLWVWVKSWDLGYALVFVIRDLMWDMLKHKVNGFDQEVNWDDPGSIFALIMHNDPLASQNVYWEMVAFLTVSVPVLTAQFCLGATGMLNMFQLGIDQTAGRFRQFETGKGRRRLANPMEKNLADRPNKVGNHFGTTALGMEAANPDNNPHGAQTAFGESVGSDDPGKNTDPGSLLSRTRQQIGGMNASRALAARKVSDALVNIGTPGNLDKLQGSLANARDLESRANQGVPGSARPMKLPNAFPGASALDKPISSDQAASIVDEMGRRNAETGFVSGACPEGKTWSEYLKEHAEDVNNGKSDDKKERLVIPHLMRGLPDLGSRVDQDVLDDLYKKGDPLNNGSGTTWRQVFERETQDRANEFAGLAAVVGRKYHPEAAKGGAYLFEAAKMQAVSSHMFGGLMDNAEANYMPGSRMFFNSILDLTGESYGSAVDYYYNVQGNAPFGQGGVFDINPESIGGDPGE